MLRMIEHLDQIRKARPLLLPIYPAWYSFEHKHWPYTFGSLEFRFERSTYEAQTKILEGWVNQ